MHVNRELAEAIKLLHEAAERRRTAPPDSHAFRAAVADEERLNARVMELVRERSRRPIVRNEAPLNAERSASPVVGKRRVKLDWKPQR
ncbi:MAG: hypothetical protein QOG32_1306 [Chloroflexota bacterium]|jgi:hypothetical protein|nr:hypothetical protein [Chloroflexota bacterium]